MKIYLDSADIKEIKEIRSCGILGGVTTNPTLIKQAVEKYKIKNLEKYLIKVLEICIDKPVSLEVAGTTYKEMISEGTILHDKFKRYNCFLNIKIPINPSANGKDKSFDGLKTIKELSNRMIDVNCTLIFTPEQAILAAEAGAKMVSPFVGRVDDYIQYRNRDDNGITSGVDLVSKINSAFHPKLVYITCKILAASIRSPRQLREVAIAGADIATVPYRILKDSLKHAKTEEGMEDFIKDIVPEYSKLLNK